jgi:hypothetical protein
MTADDSRFFPFGKSELLKNLQIYCFQAFDLFGAASCVFRTLEIFLKRYMCGIFGIFSHSTISQNVLNVLVRNAVQCGKNSSGLITYCDLLYKFNRENYDV